jgi:limonene-1,2-epoxide hydrolase
MPDRPDSPDAADARDARDAADAAASPLRRTGTPDHDTAKDPPAVVTGFLHALERFDLDAALDLVADDLVYINVTLPTLRGRDRLEQLARPVVRPDRMGFHVHFNHVAADGDVVLTDRIDELNFRRFAMRFWVYGRFVVRDGRIAVWRDSFDWVDVTIGALRGLIGLVAPAFNRRMPADTGPDD